MSFICVNHSVFLCWNTPINRWPFWSCVIKLVSDVYIRPHVQPFSLLWTTISINIIYFGQRGTTMSPCQVLLIIYCTTTSTRATLSFWPIKAQLQKKNSEFVCVLTNDHILAMSFKATKTDNLELIISKSCHVNSAIKFVWVQTE